MEHGGKLEHFWKYIWQHESQVLNSSFSILCFDKLLQTFSDYGRPSKLTTLQHQEKQFYYFQILCDVFSGTNGKVFQIKKNMKLSVQQDDVDIN